MMETAEQAICTIGYQGKDIDEFVQELVEANVQVLVDIRRRALSRKPGFSKKRLLRALAECRIEYVHYPDLGMPAELMPERNLDDNTRILHLYGIQLPAHDSLISEVMRIAMGKRVCLLCFEADHTLCHRNVLAMTLRKGYEFDIVHL